MPEHPGPPNASAADAESDTDSETDDAHEPAAPEPDDRGPAAPGSPRAS